MNEMDRFKIYNVGIQRDRKIIMTMPVIYSLIEYLLKKFPGYFGIFSKDVFLSSFTLAVFIFSIGLVAIKREYELCVNEGFIEYSRKGKQKGKHIKVDAIDLVNPIGVIYFKDVKGIKLNKEENMICLFLGNTNTVFYQWHKVEKERLEEIYENLNCRIIGSV